MKIKTFLLFFIAFNTCSYAQLVQNKSFNMVGGIFEWKNQNNIVVDNSGAETQKVHAYGKTWGMWLNKGEKVYN